MLHVIECERCKCKGALMYVVNGNRKRWLCKECAEKLNAKEAGNWSFVRIGDEMHLFYKDEELEGLKVVDIEISDDGRKVKCIVEVEFEVALSGIEIQNS